MGVKPGLGVFLLVVLLLLGYHLTQHRLDAVSFFWVFCLFFFSI